MAKKGAKTARAANRIVKKAMEGASAESAQGRNPGARAGFRAALGGMSPRSPSPGSSGDNFRAPGGRAPGAGTPGPSPTATSTGPFRQAIRPKSRKK